MSTRVVYCQHSSCNRSFKTEASMLQHYKVLHCHDDLQDKRFACECCSKSFPTNVGLQAHMRSVHLIPLDQLPPFEDIAPPELQMHLGILDVACNDCGVTFKSIDSLHQHQWAVPDHTRVSKLPNPNHGTRVRACLQCDAKLPTPEHLDQHFTEHHPISEVSKSDKAGMWQHVEERFRSAWTKWTIKLYKVHRIFKVYNPGSRRQHFEEYRKELKKEMSNLNLEKKDNPELCKKVLRDGNELQRYHGTTVKCRLGCPPKPKEDCEALSLCSDNECSLCRILQTGFKKSKCRVTKFQRFGEGIYNSATSSKSAAYVKCSNSAHKGTNSNYFSCFSGIFFKRKKNYKVMMVCRVLAGVPHDSTYNLQHLKGPPDGFHSVHGVPGKKLNYDELVVYDDRAILPAYIILYTSSN